ncbi:Cutinase [Penicillium ucsense]|uniref:Cutinase n=1 Tax=Penicillium ucsense TaxID=2839758 RepID=A0A8J8VWI8_9EURO|nr:Cutinase [Penicillium ucsense]KAF7730477.1 Cutinase [Penicillium ucsense]
MRFNTDRLFFLSLGVAVSAAPVQELNERDLVERGAGFNTFLSILLSNLPVIDTTITQGTSLITDFDNVLGALTGAQTTYNELGGTCRKYTVIFARGTAEPGNVGVLVGPPLFDAMDDQFGSSAITVQGVNDYSASVQGYLAGGDPNGSAEMARQIKAAKAQCPGTKLIASGYSQGCQIVHNAINQLDSVTASWISSVLLFGDPLKGQAMNSVPASRVFTACHAADDICKDGILIGPSHLTYAVDAVNAVKFAASL